MLDPATGNGYAINNHTSTNLHFYLVTAASFSQQTAPAGAYALNDAVRIFVDGDDLVITINTVEVIRFTETTYRAALKPGIIHYDQTSRSDDWTDNVAAPAGNQLISWQQKGAQGVMVAM